MGSEIWSIYNEKYFEKLTLKNSKINKSTHILCIHTSFWRFLPFYACFAIIVIPIPTVTPRIYLSSRSTNQTAVPVICLQFLIHKRNARQRRHQDRACYTTGTNHKNPFSSRLKIPYDFPYHNRLTSFPLGQSLKSYDPYKPSILSLPNREISERSYRRHTSNHQTTLLNITKNQLSKEEKL